MSTYSENCQICEEKFNKHPYEMYGDKDNIPNQIKGVKRALRLKYTETAKKGLKKLDDNVDEVHQELAFLERKIEAIKKGVTSSEINSKKIEERVVDFKKLYRLNPPKKGDRWEE